MIQRAALVVAACAAGCAGEAAQGRPFIHKVTLLGVKHVNEKDLRNRLALEETSWLPLARKKFLDPFVIDADRARIEAYYRAHGYFAAQVISADTRPYKHGGVDVVIVVDEGKPTHIVSVTTSGLEPLGGLAARLRRKIVLAPGRVFNHEQYTGIKDAIAGELKKLGFAWADVTGHVEIDRDARTAKVQLAVDAGPRTHFRHVHVHGTRRVDARLVALHTGVREGDPFSPDAIEAVRGRIYSLGVFSSVSVSWVRVPDDDQAVDLVITVREGSFHDLRLGGGIEVESLRNDVHLTALYSIHNFRGGLRTLRLSLAPAYVFIPAVWHIARQGPALQAEAQLTQPNVPWALSTLRFTLGFDIGIDYAYQYFGPRTSLAWSRGFFRDHLLVGASYNFQFLKFFGTDPEIFLDPSQTGILFGYVDPYRLGYWQEELALDLRDRPLDAHSGAYLTLRAEQGGVYAGGAFTYEKLEPELRGYVPLGRRVTFAVRAQFGQIFSQGDLGSPVTRRLFLGGPASHRGFNYNRLSLQVPSGIYGVPPIPIGGDQALLVSGELRVDVLQIHGQWLAFAAFLDGGDVAAPSCGAPTANSTCALFGRAPTHVSLTNLHWAAGGGLRLRTIVGTVRFDLGVRLNRTTERQPDGTPNPDPGQRFAFHISVGEAF
jgi:translocation and assembly module TamA